MIPALTLPTGGPAGAGWVEQTPVATPYGYWLRIWIAVYDESVWVMRSDDPGPEWRPPFSLPRPPGWRTSRYWVPLRRWWHRRHLPCLFCRIEKGRWR